MTIYNDKECSKCGTSFDGGSILETFLKQREEGVKVWQGKSDEEIEQDMKEHYSPPYRWGNQIGVELPWNHPDHYDGISYWQCPNCKTTWNRFTRKEEQIT